MDLVNNPASIKQLQESLALHLVNLASEEACKNWIAQYDQAMAEKSPEAIDYILNNVRDKLFTGHLKQFLRAYFNGSFSVDWSTFTKVGYADEEFNPNTLWHLDGGITSSLKLFVYLNPVSEHKGNTLMMDKDRTDQLLKANHLPVEQDLRLEDISAELLDLGLDPRPIAFDLKAGDGLLFDPAQLAHKCLLPGAGKSRYAICYVINPGQNGTGYS
jgi:hypothetical protein